MFYCFTPLMPPNQLKVLSMISEALLLISNKNVVNEQILTKIKTATDIY